MCAWFSDSSCAWSLLAFLTGVLISIELTGPGGNNGNPQHAPVKFKKNIVYIHCYGYPGVVVVGCISGMCAARVAVIVIVATSAAHLAGAALAEFAAFVASSSGLHWKVVVMSEEAGDNTGRNSPGLTRFLPTLNGNFSTPRRPCALLCAQVPAATSTTHSWTSFSDNHTQQGPYNSELLTPDNRGHCQSRAPRRRRQLTMQGQGRRRRKGKDACRGDNDGRW
ncbi:hypothetical protein EDB86DRAFT_3239844 [Lactarius hatsudake]|nr:hypothetical protein EDB86DRAFT_3239844 [Lactarius hatsudake]